MATSEADPKLLHVAEAVADGNPVDWNGVVAREPELAGELNALHSIECVAKAYRAVHEEGDPDGVTGSVLPTTVPYKGSRLPVAGGGRSWIAILAIIGVLATVALWLARTR